MRHTGCTDKLQKYTEEVKRFERELEERHRYQMRQEMAEYLEGLDRKASEAVIRRGGYESKGLGKRRILTGVGLVGVRVRCYQNRRGHRIYPLRDICGIGDETERARGRCVRMVVERSYGWSAKVLQEEMGMQLGRMRLWKIAQEEGRRVDQELEALRRRVFEEAQGAVEAKGSTPAAIIEMDGTLLASREPGEQDAYGRQRMEVKVGVMFRGSQQISPKRRKTVQRTVYGRVAEAEAFGEQWYVHCRRAGLRTQEPVQVIADGGAWIRTIRQAQFPGSRYTLDLYHLKRRARTVLLEHQYRYFCRLVKTNLIEMALEYVDRLRPSDDRHREALQQFRDYLQQNREGLHYQPGQVWGSGVIEKMADLVVGKRMKRQGMIWSRQGANNLLALRSQYLNTIAP
jgi:hypothetical protein